MGAGGGGSEPSRAGGWRSWTRQGTGCPLGPAEGSSWASTLISARGDPRGLLTSGNTGGRQALLQGLALQAGMALGSESQQQDTCSPQQEKPEGVAPSADTPSPPLQFSTSPCFVRGRGAAWPPRGPAGSPALCCLLRERKGTLRLIWASVSGRGTRVLTDRVTQGTCTL